MLERHQEGCLEAAHLFPIGHLDLLVQRVICNCSECSRPRELHKGEVSIVIILVHCFAVRSLYWSGWRMDCRNRREQERTTRTLGACNTCCQHLFDNPNYNITGTQFKQYTMQRACGAEQWIYLPAYPSGQHALWESCSQRLNLRVRSGQPPRSRFVVVNLRKAEKQSRSCLAAA